MSEKKQKVLIVHNYYQIPGGEDTVVANEKKMLENHGHEVVLYTRHNSELKSLSKVKKILLPVSSIFNFQTYQDIKNIIKEQKIDVVHVHNTLNLISPAVYYAARVCHKPVIQTIHNFRLLCPGATFYRNEHICEDCVTKGLGCAVKYSCYRNNKIQTLACVLSTWIHRTMGIYGKLNYICLTKFNKDKLLRLKQIKGDNVFVKPNFVEKSEKIVPYSERKNQFIYVGRLDKLKGVDFLLEAWKEFCADDFKLVVCGTGPLEQWCKDYVEEQGLHNVELKGFIENKKARKMIGESKALILPTQWYEGFPMTIVESDSVGTPVAGSDLGNTGSLIEEGMSGWKFAADSKKELCIALTKAKIAINGINSSYIEKYSEENNYIQLREIYETCCNHN